jgi:hypothetical protein
MQRLLRLEETSPFAWEQVAPSIPMETLDNATGALGGTRLVLDMDVPTMERYSQATADVHTVGTALAESEFLGGLASGLILQGRNNPWLARELASSRPTEAYRLGLFAGASALQGHLDLHAHVLDDAVHEEIRAMAVELRDDEAVKGYVKADRPKVLAMAKRARTDVGFRSTLVRGAVDSLIRQEAVDTDAAERFRVFLGPRTEAQGVHLGRAASKKQFAGHTRSLDGTSTLPARLEEASAFVGKIVDALPAQVYDLPLRDHYNRGVRRSLAFVALAAAAGEA